MTNQFKNIRDMHAHYGTLPDGGYFEKTDLIKIMDRLDIASLAVSALDSLYCDWRKGNESVKNLALDYPGRFYWYAVINPYDMNNFETYLDSVLSEKYAIGIKLHPDIHTSNPVSDEYMRVYEYANRKKLLVQNHKFGTAQQLVEVAKTFSNMKMIAAHAVAQFKKSEIPYLVKNLKDRAEIFFDTTSSSTPYGALEEFTECFGPEKVSFGTDMPFLDPAFQIGRILYSELTDKQKHIILCENGERILNLFMPV